MNRAQRVSRSPAGSEALSVAAVRVLKRMREGRKLSAIRIFPMPFQHTVGTDRVPDRVVQELADRKLIEGELYPSGDMVDYWLTTRGAQLAEAAAGSTR